MLVLPLLGSAAVNINLTVTLAVEEDCSIKKPADEHFFKSLIAEISADLEKEFALGLAVENYIHWKSDDKPHRSLDSLLIYFTRTVPKGHADMVIGFTCRKGLKGKKGISYYQEGYVLIQKTKNREFIKKLLKHEIFHIFGATHVDNPGSLMDRWIKGESLDPLNREIVFLHRDRAFKGVGFPLAPSKLERVEALYREMARLNELLPTVHLEPFKRMLLGKGLLSENPSREMLIEIREKYRGLEHVYLSLALLCIELKKYPEAVAESRKALRIDPQCYEAYNLMGIAYRRSGKYEEAIAHYREVLKLNPSYQGIYYNLGIAYEHKGEEGSAISAYKKAIAWNPIDARAWYNLGNIYRKKGDLDTAIHHFKKAVEYKPYYAEAYYNLSVIYKTKKDFQQAFRYMQEAERLGYPVDKEFKTALEKALASQ